MSIPDPFPTFRQKKNTKRILLERSLRPQNPDLLSSVKKVSIQSHNVFCSSSRRSPMHHPTGPSGHHSSSGGGSTGSPSHHHHGGSSSSSSPSSTSSNTASSPHHSHHLHDNHHLQSQKSPQHLSSTGGKEKAHEKYVKQKLPDRKLYNFEALESMFLNCIKFVARRIVRI